VTILLDGLAGEVPVEQKEHLGTVLGSANQLLAMIDDLLEATRAESGKLRIEPRCINIDDTVMQAVTMLRAAANEKQIALKMTVDNGLPLVSADPERVLQILLNLIDNSLKFTPAGGSVTVNAALSPQDPTYVCISVTDTGRGVSPESKHLIFERLYQDPNSSINSRKGLGLGLHIVQELVKLHGGRIWVESQPGHGSVFSFTLPLFSLSKLLAPIVNSFGKLPDPLVLITVEGTPKPQPGLPRRTNLRLQCMDILRSCVSPDKDIVLPALSGENGHEIFMVVAAADERATEILLKRITGQFDRLIGLQSRIEVRVFAQKIRPPQQDSDVPALAQLEQQLAEVINRVAIPARGQQPSTAIPEFDLILPGLADGPVPKSN
jgi:hypothetical protein